MHVGRGVGRGAVDGGGRADLKAYRVRAKWRRGRGATGGSTPQHGARVRRSHRRASVREVLLMARARRGAARTWDEVSVGGKGPGRTQGTFGRFVATTPEGHVRITSQHISHNTSHRRNRATFRPPRNLSCNTSQYLAASRSPFRILSQPLVPEGWTFGRRDTNFGGSSISHHITYRRSTDAASRAVIVHDSGARGRWQSGQFL